MSYRESTKSNPCSMAAVAGMAALVTCLAACNDAARIDVPTSPLSLEGTSPVEWSSHERISHFISAADGVRLAVDVVLPAGYTGEGEGATSFPVVFRYTPYHRTSIVPETGEVPLAPFDSFIARGYACVAADFTHDASFGPPLDASQISVANAMKGKAPFNAPSFGHSRQQMFGVPGDLPYRAEKDEQVLTYTSTPLEADTEVTGHPTERPGFLHRRPRGSLLLSGGRGPGGERGSGHRVPAPRRFRPPRRQGPHDPGHHRDRREAGASLARLPRGRLHRPGLRRRGCGAGHDLALPHVAAVQDGAQNPPFHRGGEEGSYVELPVIPR